MGETVAWHDALDTFLAEWKEKDVVEGAVLTGSYAADAATDRSDVDVCIVLSDEAEWRERGNQVIDGVLVEYFANPVRQIRYEFEERMARYEKTTARMFAIGQILFDENGVVKELQEEAREWLEERFDSLDEDAVEIAKYSLWNSLDDLKDLHERSQPHTRFFANIVLKRVYEHYAKFCRAEIYNPYRIHQLFTDPDFRDRYRVNAFPDAAFGEKFVDAITEEDLGRKVEKTGTVVEHVLEEMGGFEIDGWTLRSTPPVDEK